MKNKPAFIDARPAFEIITKNAIESWPSADNFGPVRPQFDQMWLEGEDWTVLPDGVTPLRYAVHIIADAPALHVATGHTDRRHSMKIYTMSPEGFAQDVPIRIIFTVDEDGRLDEFMRGVDPEDFSWFQGCDEDHKQTLTALAQCGAISALFTLSLMHSRNVKTAPETYTPAKKRKTSRQRPSIEYHTIKLPTPRSSASGSGELTGTTKLHTARGHFKTYTEAAPLMGKHVGTYYWGWQVRGNRKNGEIISSYEVGAA